MMLDKFGLHTLIDFKGSENVNSEETIREFVDDLVKEIKMTKYGDCHVNFFGDTPDVAGFSFFQLIEESNISGHLCSYDYMMKDKDGNEYNNKGAGYIDVFSCGEYDPQVAVEVVKKWFKPTTITSQSIERI